jgi:hypothetical protein
VVDRDVLESLSTLKNLLKMNFPNLQFDINELSDVSKLFVSENFEKTAENMKISFGTKNTIFTFLVLSNKMTKLIQTDHIHKFTALEIDYE